MRFLFSILLLLRFATVAHAQTANGRPINELNGKDLYGAACATCHGADGKASPQSLVGFEVPIPDFTDCSFATPEADPDWEGIVKYGGPVRAFDRKMPGFGDALSDEQIGSVVDYLRTFCEDKGWPQGDLNLPRPLVTEKAFPENEAVLTTTIRRGSGSVGNDFVYEHRIGKRGQYEVSVPLDFRHGLTGGWNRGLGDVEVQYKHVLFHSMNSGSILSAGGEVVFPTGKETEGLGGGHTVAGAFGAFGQILPRDSFFHLHAGWEHPITKAEAANEGFWRMALGKTFMQANGGRAWSPMIEALASREMEEGAKTEWDFVPEVQVSLSKRQHILLNAGFRFPLNQRQERGKSFIVYLLWDWFDGGLFSGW